MSRLLLTLVAVVLIYICFVECAPDYSGCGESTVARRARIIRGSRSSRGMWPWQVGIYKKRGSKYRIICGGALITPQWVLTAAHCFYVRRKSNTKIWYEEDTASLTRYKIIAGDHNIRVKESTEQARFPSKVYVHPGYRHAPYYENDIALVRLKEAVTLGPSVRTVCLPNTTNDLAKPGSLGTVAGWGKTLKSQRSSGLRHSSFKIQSDTFCDEVTNYFFNRTVTFCAGDGKGNRDTCHGDSGGSMVKNVLVNGQHRWVTVGLVSWGEGCAVKNNYGYYTRLYPFVKWIQNKIRIRVKNDANAVKNLYDDGIEIKCRDGFDKFGVKTLGCRSENWKIEIPVCKARCPDPGVPENGFLINSSSIVAFSHGIRIKFGCNDLYTLINGQSVLECQNGRWSDAIPWCIARCPDPGVPDNGFLINSSSIVAFSPGIRIKFGCNDLYTLSGQSVLECQNGRWSDPIPWCTDPDTSKYCKDPGIPEGGLRYDHSFQHSDRVRFACKSGWIMKGAEVIWCNNGVWSKPAPKCMGTVQKLLCNDYLPWTSIFCR